MLDLGFAIAHHLLVFGLFGVLFAELVVVRPGLAPQAAARVASLDVWYGLLAGLIVLVGFARAGMAAKGWAYYSHNLFFWAKIGVFLLIGLISIAPTLAFLRWRGSKGAPGEAELRATRRLLWIELALFPLILAFAAAMARGYGQMG